MPSCTGRTPTRVNLCIPSHPRITPRRSARIARSISLDLEEVSKSNLLGQRKLSNSGAISQRHLGHSDLNIWKRWKASKRLNDEFHGERLLFVQIRCWREVCTCNAETRVRRSSTAKVATVISAPASGPKKITL